MSYDTLDHTDTDRDEADDLTLTADQYDTGESTDLDDADSYLGEADEDETAESGATASSARPAARAITRAQVRRIVAKTLEVAEAPEDTRKVASALLGCTSAVADLSASIVLAKRGVLAPVTDVKALAAADPLEAGIDAATMGRDRIKAMWTLLTALGALKSDLPASDPKAALALVKTIHTLDEMTNLALDEAVALVKKA